MHRVFGRVLNCTVQVGSYGDPGRDPRGWTVTVAYAAVVPSTELGVKAAVSVCKQKAHQMTC